MKKYYYSLIIAIIFSACSNHESIADEELSGSQITEDKAQVKIVEENSNQEFIELYSSFVQTLFKGGDGKLNSPIHSNKGVYLITNFNGAMPQITKCFKVSCFDHDEIIRLTFERLDSSTLILPKFSVLPKVICDTTIYDKQGCFAQEINPLLESRIWNYANLNEKEIQAIEFLAETVKITVVNTSKFTFYFSKIEGKWYITFIDLRVPCSA